MTASIAIPSAIAREQLIRSHRTIVSFKSVTQLTCTRQVTSPRKIPKQLPRQAQNASKSNYRTKQTRKIMNSQWHEKPKKTKTASMQPEKDRGAAAVSERPPPKTNRTGRTMAVEWRGGLLQAHRTFHWTKGQVGTNSPPTWPTPGRHVLSCPPLLPPPSHTYTKPGFSCTRSVRYLVWLWLGRMIQAQRLNTRKQFVLSLSLSLSLSLWFAASPSLIIFMVNTQDQVSFSFSSTYLLVCPPIPSPFPGSSWKNCADRSIHDENGTCNTWSPCFLLPL